MLEINLTAWKWDDLFSSENHKCIIINMDKNSDISISSTANKVYQNLSSLANKYKMPVLLLNCDNLSINDFNEEKNKIENGLLVLKNFHLANQELLNSINATILHGNTCCFLNYSFKN